tara:strand:+ start:10223 stop:11347 length:1125 start_codon:yes stop_codon:yes gene_type:complete
MGLDVYLYRYEDFEKQKALERQLEAFRERTWAEVEDYNALTQEQKDEIQAKIARASKAMGYKEDAAERVEIDSKQYPDHMFKIGYIRSSYNSGGINSVLDSFIGKSLYYAFRDNDNDEYSFRPDWAIAKERCEEMLLEFQQACDKIDNCYIHEQQDFGLLFRRRGSGIQGLEEATAVFQENYERVKERPNGETLNYGPFETITYDMDELGLCPIRSQTDLIENFNEESPFIERFDEPIKVRGIISTTTYTMEREGCFNSGKYVYGKPVSQRTTYVFYDTSQAPQPEYGGHPWDSGWYSGGGGSFMFGEPPVVKMIARTHILEPGWRAGPVLYMAYQSDDEAYLHYKQSLEVVIEMCEWVLDREEQEQYILHWSS